MREAIERAMEHHRAGRLAEAEAGYREVLRAEPDQPSVYHNLGCVLAQLGRFAHAEQSFRKALAIDPGYAEAHFNLGNVLLETNRVGEAMQALRLALSLKPDYADAHNNLGFALLAWGRSDEALACYERAQALSPHDVGYGRNRLSCLLHAPRVTAQELFAAARALASRFAQPETVRLPSLPLAARAGTASRGRIDVGFLGSDFRANPVALNIRALFEHRDSRGFSYTVYSAVNSPDDLTGWFRERVDRWRDVAGMSDRAIAELVRQDGIDVLMFLAGIFGSNRPGVAAWRAAPVQVSFLDGLSSGIDEMDYWLTDGVLHPQDTAEQFSESLYRLPALFSYPAPEADLPDPGPLPALEKGRITFGCFCHPRKVTEFAIELWSRVLHAVPESELILKNFARYEDPAAQAYFRGRFASHGAGPERILFLPGSGDRLSHLKDHQSIDVALDTYPFTGATTSFEALAMGVPVLTLAGDTFIRRMTASLLAPIGLEELIVGTADEFVARAKALACDLPRLARLRGALRERIAASRLCDGPAFSASFEAALRAMLAAQ